MPRILVADDNTNIQKMVSLALQERGVEVTSVSNGEAAVRRVPDLNPDLILADIFMPVRNGYELCEWVKKDSKYSHIPVILLVGAFDPLDEKEARRVGADGVLKKPFIPPDPLIAMVTSTLEKIPKATAEPAPVKLSPPPAPPLPAPAASTPMKVTPAPEPVISAPDREEAAPEFDFGAGRNNLQDEPENFAGVTAPQADFGQQQDDGVDEPEPQSHWRPSSMAFEVPQENSQAPGSARDVGVPAPDGGHLHSEGHARELAGTLDTEDSIEFFDEPPTPISPPQEPAGSLDSRPESAAPHVPEPEPSFSSKSSHWMDLMSSNEAGQPQRDWLSSIAASQSTEHLSPLETANKTENREVAPPSIEPSARASDVLAPSSEQLQENTQSAPSSEGDWFFADEAQTSGASVSAPTEEVHAPEPPLRAAEESDPVHIEWPATEQGGPIPAAKPRQDSAVDTHQVDSSVSLNHEDASDGSKAVLEPELAMPTPVRPAPELLLIDEFEKKSSDYDAREEEIPPAFSFLPEVEKQSAAPSASAAAEMEAPLSAVPDFSHEADAFPASAESHLDASFAEPPASHAQDASVPAGEDSASSFGSVSSAASHEIPAAGSPSREDVAAIPFLNPPADFDQDENEGGSSMHERASADAVAIDDVVDRVLSRIEPQLRDLLSQNLKPLIESLVQNELQKKER